MGQAIEFQISPVMINWIAEQENTEPQSLAERLAPKKVNEFLAGLVTKGVAEKLAKIANIPFGFLFLHTPPAMDKPKIPDLRQIIGAEPLSKDFIAVLQDTERKVGWYKDYLIENGSDAPLDFVNKYPFSKELDYREIARDIAATIRFSIEKELTSINRNDYYRILTLRFEKVGILIFKSGIVGSNTRRKLNVEEFRGFTLIDKIAPAIFINGADHPSAQIFTLLHEIAHIWIGQDGVSSWNQDREVEAFCNKVAAQFLMPDELFYKYWNNIQDDKIETTASYFKVSYLATVIKAVQLKLLPCDSIESARSYLKKIKKENNSGGDFYKMFPIKNSPRFTEAVVNQAISQRITLREAGKLLNTHADTIVGYYHHKRKELWSAS